MPPIRLAPALFFLLLGGCSRTAPEATAENPFEILERQVAQERQASGEYAPKVAGRIDDPATPAADLLRQLPGVANVEV
jgi:hypothetical protein